MRRDALCVGVVVVLAAALFGSALGVPPYVPPFGVDTVDALNLAVQDHPDFLTRGAGNFVYRPVTYYSFWLQERAVGLHPSVFLATNVLIWVGCALVAFALVRQVGGRRFIALGAAAALLTDQRVSTAMLGIIERQSILACLFGGLALLLAFRMPASGRGRMGGALGVFALLVVAMLSKEYGAAFVAATAAVGLWSRPELRRPLIYTAGAAAAGYAALRWALPEILRPNGERLTASNAGEIGAAPSLTISPGYCEDMGLLGRSEFVCYGWLGLGERLVQHGWNVGATLLSTPYPLAFAARGEFDPPSLARPVAAFIYPTVLLGLAMTAWVKRSRDALPFLVLILANAALSYLVFRHRNQIIGALGLYVSASLGLRPAAELIAIRARRRSTRIAVWSTTALLVAWGVGNTTHRLFDSLRFGKAAAALRPCTYLGSNTPSEVVDLLRSTPEARHCPVGEPGPSASNPGELRGNDAVVVAPADRSAVRRARPTPASNPRTRIH